MRNRKMRMKALRWPLLLLLAFSANEAQSAAPAGRYTVSEETVIDEVTGLTWQRVASVTISWAGANQYCGNLSLDGGGWRLPTRKELLSIVDMRATTPPVIDVTAFSGTPTNGITWFWSSSRYAFNSSYGWVVDFYGGSADVDSLGSGCRVRCVR